MPVPPAVVPVEPVQRKRPWWWWLLWLLLALLLLALLLLLPRACTPGGGFDLKRAIPGLSPPDERASEPLGERRAEVVPDTGGTLGGGGGTLGGGSVDGGTTTAPTLPGGDATLPGTLPPGTGLPPVDLPREARPDMLPDAKELPKDLPNELPKDIGRTDPPRPSMKDDANRADVDKAGPNNKPDKGTTNPPNIPTDPKALKMPDDANAAKKLGFLEGGWKAGEGLVDKNTQQPLDLSFKFGKDGQGQVTLRRPDGSTCSGAVQGRMSGGKLGIEGNQSIPCSGGGSYAAPKIECAKDRGGQTQCFGVNPDGSRYFMGMQRQ
jgi:hypothetical protein